MFKVLFVVIFGQLKYYLLEIILFPHINYKRSFKDLKYSSIVHLIYIVNVYNWFAVFWTTF